MHVVHCAERRQQRVWMHTVPAVTVFCWWKCVRQWHILTPVPLTDAFLANFTWLISQAVRIIGALATKEFGNLLFMRWHAVQHVLYIVCFLLFELIPCLDINEPLRFKACLLYFLHPSEDWHQPDIQLLQCLRPCWFLELYRFDPYYLEIYLINVAWPYNHYYTSTLIAVRYIITLLVTTG